MDGSIVSPSGPVLEIDDLALAGRGGVEDVVGASAAALTYGVDPHAVARAVKAFRPLAHRFQTVGVLDGVTYIDDSKATNPHATLSATKGLHDVVLIAGGRSKGIDLSVLAGTVPAVTAVVALGEAADEVASVFSGSVTVRVVDSMDAAVRAARALVVRGGSVLLSPGCASLDMYDDYAQRGEAFQRAVRALMDSGRGDDGNS